MISALVAVAAQPATAYEYQPYAPAVVMAEPASHSAEQSMVARLEKLEAAFATEAKLTTATAAQPGAAASMRIRGRIHLDWWTFPHASDGVAALEGLVPQDRFISRRARLEIGGTLPDFMLYKIDVDFASPTNPEFRDLYIGWEELPLLQRVLLGNQKRPYGLDQITSSNQVLFMERSLVTDAFNEGTRRAGVMSYGYTEDEVYNWRFGAFLMQPIADTGSYVGNRYQSELAGRLAATPFYDETSDGRSYVHWGVAGTVAFPSGADGPTFSNEGRFRTRSEVRSTNRWLNTGRIDGAERYELLGLEGVMNLGPLQVGSEWQGVWLHRDGAADLFFNGAYVYAAYFLTGEHQPFNRREGRLDRVRPYQNFWRVRTCHGDVASGWGAWQILARYSHLDLSDQDVLGGRGNNVTAGLNWFWNPNAKMMFNYVYGNVDQFAAGGFTSGYFHSIGSRFQVDF